MPVASAGPVATTHYWPRHTGAYQVAENPPTQNVWYIVIDEDDAELAWLIIRQSNTEVAAKSVQVRFTVDGVVYQATYNIPSHSTTYVYRTDLTAADASGGLAIDTVIRNAAYTVMWRGQAFKFEVRLTSIPGTNQWLIARAVPNLDEVT